MDFSFLSGADVVANAAAVPIIVAIVQLFKMVGNGSFMQKYAPFLSIGAGIIISLLTSWDELPIHESLLTGILYGLSASGLYSATKHTAHNIKDDPNNANDL